MGKEKENYNPDKERPGYGISNTDYESVHGEEDGGLPNPKEPASAGTVQHEVEKRLIDAAGLDSSGIAVAVSGGNVRISGVVQTDAERKLAEEAASSTPNVVRVENDLTIEPENDGSGEK